MRGLITYCGQHFSNEKRLELWFSSPNGDSSDSHVLIMDCDTVEQASDLCATWNIIIKNIDSVVGPGFDGPLHKVSQ